MTTLTVVEDLDVLEDRRLGLHTVRNPADIGATVARALKGSGAGVHARAGA